MYRDLTIGTFVLAATVVLSTVNAHAQQWQVCNRTPDALSVAVGYAVPGGRIVAEGWFTLGPCTGCEVVALPEETVDRSIGYLWAKPKGRPAIIEGSEPLCVNMDKASFKIRSQQGGGQSCKDRKFATRSFQKVNIDMTKDFTTNIRGQRQCNL